MSKVIINLDSGYNLATVTAALPEGCSVLTSGVEWVFTEDSGKANALLETDIRTALDLAAVAYNSVCGI